MRVRLDRGLCQGHGRCYALAPELFDCDDEGFPVVKVAEGVLADGQEDAARLAAGNCPEFAISVDEG